MTPETTNGASGQRDAVSNKYPPKQLPDPEGNTFPRHPVVIDPALGREWAKPKLAKVEPGVPMFCTAEWAALPDSDPHKWAAIVYAALAHADQYSPEAIRERAELDEFLDRAAEKQAALVMSDMWWDRGRTCMTCRDDRGQLLMAACPRLKTDRNHGYRSDYPDFHTLRERRSVVPPTREIDPMAVARWVATGSSEPQPTTSRRDAA